jgi:hypothetical protein
MNAKQTSRAKSCFLPANRRTLFGRCFNAVDARYCYARFRATGDRWWLGSMRRVILGMA